MSVSKKVKSSVMIHEDIWKKIRILAITENKEIGELVEEIFKERLDRSYHLIQEQLSFSEPQSVPSNIITTPTNTINLEDLFSEERSGIFNENNISALTNNGTLYEIFLPELKFPIDKEGLVQYAKELPHYRSKKDVLFLIGASDIPGNKIYKDISVLEEDIGKFFNRIPIIDGYKKKHGISKPIKLKINTKGNKNLLDSHYDKVLDNIKTAS